MSKSTRNGYVTIQSCNRCTATLEKNTNPSPSHQHFSFSYIKLEFDQNTHFFLYKYITIFRLLTYNVIWVVILRQNNFLVLCSKYEKRVLSDNKKF